MKLKFKLLIINVIILSRLFSQCEDITDYSDCMTDPECEWDSDCLLCYETMNPVCPDDSFLDMDEWPGPGPGYPDPFLNAYCDETSIYVESNGMPNFNFIQMTPHELEIQNWNWVLPRFPIYQDVITSITDGGGPPTECETTPQLGMLGIAVNGMPFFGPTEGPFPDPYGDPIYNDITDYCMGHTAELGVYHHHSMLTECLSLSWTEGEPSPILGYAADGFPIYGPFGCLDSECNEVVEFQSSYEQIADPTNCAFDAFEYVDQDNPVYLDECNGRFGPDGDYRYHTTETFPYIIGCFHGIPDEGADSGGEDYDLGDVNFDSIINILDVIHTINIILESSQNHYADMNEDCTVDILDIVLIVNIILGN